METKPWYLSKTIWSGIVAVLIGCYNTWVANQATFGVHLPVIPDAVFAVLGFFGIYSRSVATTSITK